jgi:hypothetical protein
LRAYNSINPHFPGPKVDCFPKTASKKSLMRREGRQSKLQSNAPNIPNIVGHFLQFFIPVQLPLGLMPELIFSCRRAFQLAPKVPGRRFESVRLSGTPLDAVLKWSAAPLWVLGG